MFGATNCFIKTKRGGDLVLFKPNEVQRILDAFVQLRLESGRPAWFIVLKARQFGVSTWGIKEQYSRINFKQNHDTLFAAHDEDSTKSLFERARIMHDNNPEKYPTKYSSVRQIKLEHQNSSMTIQTMGKGELGRSGVYNDVHLSELAFCDVADTVMTSVVATMPQPHLNPDTIFCIESTANGQGGTYYDLWCSSTPLFNRNYISLPKSEDDRVGIFFPWYIFDDNQIEPHKHFKDQLTDYDDDVFGNEHELMELFNLSLRQMSWRRWEIKNKYNSNLNKFKQENPATDAEAFLSTGRPVFAQGGLTYQTGLIATPVFKGQFTEGGELDSSGIGMIEIFEQPHKGATYVMGYDPAEGLDPEEKNNPDAGCAHIIRVDTKRVVATVYGQADVSIMCKQVCKLGRLYNDAWFAFEINNTMGGACREIVKADGYPNIYMREEVSKRSNQTTEVIGWRTDVLTRGTLIKDMQEVIRERLITVVAKGTVDEMGWFVFDKNGKAVAKSGEHDDRVMSLSITIQLLLRTIKRSTIILPDEAVDRMISRPDYDGTENFYINTLAYNGAVDYMLDMEEDNDDIY